MKEFYEKNPYPLPICCDHLYATKFKATQEWERVKIINNIEKFYCCYFVDKGITDFVSEEKLFLLDDQFKQLPPRSAKAALSGILLMCFKIITTLMFNLLICLQISTTIVGPLKVSNFSRLWLLSITLLPLFMMW